MKEYKVVVIDYSSMQFQKMEQELNQLASNGWSIMFCKDFRPNQHIMFFILERFKTN